MTSLRFPVLRDEKDAGSTTMHHLREGGMPHWMEMARQAVEDRRLADELLRLPRRVRARAVSLNAKYHRLSLAKALLLEAEGALVSQGDRAAEAALAGAAVALAVPADQRKSGLASLGHWLAGMAFLRAGAWALAEEALRTCSAQAGAGDSSEQGLAAYGWGELRQRQGHAEAAVGHYAKSFALFSHRGSSDAGAACAARIGLLLAQQGDLLAALTYLRRALLQLDDFAAAPALAARMLLIEARCEARLLMRPAAEGSLVRAHELYPLTKVPGEALMQSWCEAAVEAELGYLAGAEVHLHEVRLWLSKKASLAEAETCAFDEALVRVARGGEERSLRKDLAVLRPFLAAEAGSTIDGVLRLGGGYETHARRLLGERMVPFFSTAPLEGRGPELLPTAALTDRLLRSLPEYGDPFAMSEGE